MIAATFMNKQYDKQLLLSSVDLFLESCLNAESVLGRNQEVGFSDKANLLRDCADLCALLLALMKRNSQMSQPIAMVLFYTCKRFPATLTEFENKVPEISENIKTANICAKAIEDYFKYAKFNLQHDTSN